MNELELNENNPYPFVQPFLEFYFRDGGGESWLIDVNGQIDLYLKDWTRVNDALHQMVVRDLKSNLPCVHFNWMSQATPLLQEVIQKLTDNGWHIHCVSGYVGSAGPSYMLRNGAFYQRFSIECQKKPLVEDMKPTIDIAKYLQQILDAAVS